MFASRFSFDGKIVLITGGSRGLGLALAREACADRARVALLARDSNELARARDDLTRRGGDALPVECDLLEPAQIKQAVERIVDHFGGLDVVINNAGIIEAHRFRESNDASFLGSLPHYWRSDSAFPPARRRAHRQHLFHRRENRRSAHGAIHGEQIRSRWFLGCDSRRVSARKYLRHYRHARNDAYRLAWLREIQGRSRDRI